MVVKKREIIVTICIIGIMILLGFCIYNKIVTASLDSDEKYNMAIQINNDAEQFEYGMRTNIGYAFVQGDIKAKDTVDWKEDEIDGEYIYIEKEHEHYTMHTRRVKSGKTWHTQIYYTWDHVSTERKYNKQVYFCNNLFDSEKFEFSNKEQVGYNKKGNNRWFYRAIPKEFSGTIFTKLENNTINDRNTFYDNCDIVNLKEYCTTHHNWLFWVCWIPFIGLLVGLFCYAENNWLD